jgi:hypothetical protein
MIGMKHRFLDHSAFSLESQGIVVRFPTGEDLTYFNFQLSEVPALLWYELLRWKQHRYFVGVLYGVRYAAEKNSWTSGTDMIDFVDDGKS